MKTWSEELKQYFLDGANFRQEHNLFKQGEWLNTKEQYEGVFCGCMHGGLIQSEEDVIRESADAMQWPVWLTDLSEAIFEGLPREEYQLFPVQLIEAVPVDTDHDLLLDVRAKVEIARLERLKTIQSQSTYPAKQEILEVLDHCISLWKRHRDSTDSDWSAAESAARSARSAAESAARSPSWSAAESVSWSAARSASWSAAESARSASWSAVESAVESARSASWSAAESAAGSAAESWQAERDSLISALNELNLEGE